MRQIERLSGAVMALLSLVTFALNAGGWAWLGRPVVLPRSPLADGKLPCVSYTPFRGTETPVRVDGAVNSTSDRVRSSPRESLMR